MPSLADKLKSLGVKIGMDEIAKAAPVPRHEIDSVVDGEYRTTRAGETFVAGQEFAAEYRYGRSAILPEAPFEALAAWAREPRFGELPLEAYAFLDTETSGLSGGTGTYAFLVGVGRFLSTDLETDGSTDSQTDKRTKADSSTDSEADKRTETDAQTGKRKKADASTDLEADKRTKADASTDSEADKRTETNGSTDSEADKRAEADSQTDKRTKTDVSAEGRLVLRLEQFFMRDPAEEAALLEGLADFLAPCRALVTFNGKGFDAPLLATRYALHNIPNPFSNFAHLDLLPLARRLWRDRLPSRALKYLEESILNAPRTSEEVPGYEIPYLYFDYLRSGDARPLKGVFYHNAMDVVAMAALLNHVTGILSDPFGEMVEHGLDVVALAKLFEDLGQWDMAARLFERGLEMELPEADFWLTVQRLSHLQKRRGDLDVAVQWWERAAGQGHVYAYVELAKYHEHRRRDYPQALEWTHKAVELVGTLDIPRYMYNHWIEELERREQRLSRKSRKDQ